MKNKTIRNHITAKNVPQAIPTKKKERKIDKKEIKNNKEQINHQKPEKRHKGV